MKPEDLENLRRGINLKLTTLLKLLPLLDESTLTLLENSLIEVGNKIQEKSE